jgi:hypothetical protein
MHMNFMLNMKGDEHVQRGDTVGAGIVFMWMKMGISMKVKHVRKGPMWCLGGAWGRI